MRKCMILSFSIGLGLGDHPYRREGEGIKNFKRRKGKNSWS